MLALVLAGLLAVMAPSAFANDTNVSLNASLIDAPDKGWYAYGEVVTISAELTNDGEATSITVDPSCNEVIKVWSDNSLIVDGSETCLGQNRGMDLGAYSTNDLTELTWDLTDSQGEPVPSGDYIVEYFVAGEELSSSVTIHVQSIVDVPEGVEMIVTPTARDGIHAESSPSIISIRLHNTLQEEVQLNMGDCRIVINDELFESCGPDNLRTGEVVTVDQVPVMLNSGENQFRSNARPKGAARRAAACRKAGTVAKGAVDPSDLCIAR